MFRNFLGKVQKVQTASECIRYGVEMLDLLLTLGTFSEGIGRGLIVILSVNMPRGIEESCECLSRRKRDGAERDRCGEPPGARLSIGM